MSKQYILFHFIALRHTSVIDKNFVHRTTVRSIELSYNKKCKMQRNAEKCREMKRNVEKCREIHRNAEKCREIYRNVEK